MGSVTSAYPMAPARVLSDDCHRIDMVAGPPSRGPSSCTPGLSHHAQGTLFAGPCGGAPMTIRVAKRLVCGLLRHAGIVLRNKEGVCVLGSWSFCWLGP